ncbi:sugar ABC transporter substrate-binding protein [Kineococcus sp. SYSU DK003]|uniref:sugar ABC transporter substrate-binding protein n=1 Tax=Kineococcus sp. SYSU DK003 TaxID=3383124 RepID=UPI003D7CEF17
MKIANDVDASPCVRPGTGQRRPASARLISRRAAALGLSLALGVSLAACNRSSDSATGSGGDKIGFSAAVLDNPFTVQLVDTVQSQGAAGGFDMQQTTNANGDTGKQITDMNTLVTQQVAGIFLIPRDSDAIVPGVEAANKAGIPVVTVDTAANGGDIYMNIRADNVAMGASVCDSLGAAIGGQGTVLELQGDLGTSSGADRHQGFADCMAQKYPGVQIIARPTDWESAKAADAAQTVLSTTDVNGVFLASDSVMLDGVTSVMKNLGKYLPAGQPGHISMVSIDGSGPSLAAIRTGELDAVVSQPINDYAKYGVSYMKDAIAGKTYAVGPTDHGSQIVEYKGNLADMLPSPVVTKANVDDSTLWGNASK